MSPHQYIVQARIESAKELLVKTALPVNNIADLCGFSSTGHLATWFKRLVGVRPLAYRGQSRG